jgi:hypothetical protein
MTSSYIFLQRRKSETELQAPNGRLYRFAHKSFPTYPPDGLNYCIHDYCNRDYSTMIIAIVPERRSFVVNDTSKA